MKVSSNSNYYVNYSPVFMGPKLKQPISKATLEKWIELGKSNKEIAILEGVSPAYISIRMREFGLRKRDVVSRDSYADLIRPLLAQNCGLKEIREGTGLGYNTIRTWIEQTYGKNIVAVKQELRKGLALSDIKQDEGGFQRRVTDYANSFALAIKELLDKGFSRSEISKRLNCSVSTVSNYVNQYFLEPTRKEKLKLLSNNIIKDLLAGVPKEEVMIKYNVSRTTIDSFVRERGLQKEVHRLLMERRRANKR